MATACISRIPAAALEHYGSATKPAENHTADIKRRELVRLIEGSLLDFQHHSLKTLLECVETLLRLCVNAGTHEERFQLVKASNPTLQKKLACKRSVADDILSKAGWTHQTMNFEKHYLMKDSHCDRLAIAIEELAKASSLLQDKLQRGSSEAEALKADQAAYREQVLANLQDDRRARQNKGSGSLKLSPERPDQVADPEAIASYRDSKHGQVQSNDDWKVNPEYVPIQFDGSPRGARESYKEE